MSTDVARPATRSVFYERTDPSLMLSTGNPPAPGRNYPQRLSFFRAKPGADGRWSGAAKAFNSFYGCEVDAAGNAQSGPKALVIRFPSDQLGDLLDVRFLAFGQGRLAAKGDTNYAIVPSWKHHEPEWVTAFPLEGEPTRFQISGPDDPLCQGGQWDIPVDQVKGKPTGKPTLVLRATLSFTLAEIGALTAITQYQTASVAIRSDLWKTLSFASTLGPLSAFLFMLRVVPGRRRYRDDQGKSHTTETHDVRLWGPIHGLDRREAITIADAAQMAEAARARIGASAPPPQLGSAPAQRPSPAPVLEPGTWSEGDDDQELTGEVVPEPDPTDGGF